MWDRFLRDLVAGSPVFRDVCCYDMTYFGGSVSEDGRVPFNVYVAGIFRALGQPFERPAVAPVPPAT